MAWKLQLGDLKLFRAFKILKSLHASSRKVKAFKDILKAPQGLKVPVRPLRLSSFKPLRSLAPT